MKSQQSSVEQYFLFFCLVIAAHAGIFFWVWQSQCGAVNSHSQDRMIISLKGGTYQPPPSQSPTLSSAPHSKNQSRISQLLAPHGGSQNKSQALASHTDRVPVGHSDLGLASRSIYSNPKPHYPLASRRMREQGSVHLKLCIGHRGAVNRVELSKSSGYANLDQSAIEAAREWRFSAIDATSTHLPECYQLPVHFSLES